MWVLSNLTPPQESLSTSAPSAQETIMNVSSVSSKTTRCYLLTLLAHVSIFWRSQFPWCSATLISSDTRWLWVPSTSSSVRSTVALSPLWTRWITNTRSQSMIHHKKLSTRRCFSRSLLQRGIFHSHTSQLISNSLMLAVWVNPKQLQFRISLGSQSRSIGIYSKYSTRPPANTWRTLSQFHQLRLRLRLALPSNSMLSLRLMSPTVTFSKLPSASCTFWTETNLRASSSPQPWVAIKPKPTRAKLCLVHQKHPSMLISLMKRLILPSVSTCRSVDTLSVPDLNLSSLWSRSRNTTLISNHVDLSNPFIKPWHLLIPQIHQWSSRFCKTQPKLLTRFLP